MLEQYKFEGTVLMNYFDRQATYSTLSILSLFLVFGAKAAIAQVNPANDGTGTIVRTQNNQINISGGTQAGQNQFHSFQQFGINAGQTANFMANPNTVNILGRVTGGNASLINGILRVTGSNANLFLINPSGMVFGKDASLNLPAAFTATTANGIGFGNGKWFNAAGTNNYSPLTTNPASFGFVGASGSLVNAGNLTVKPGQRIALVGGTVVNTGTIAAPGGDIVIAALPGGKMVRIGQTGTVLSLDLPTSDQALINAPTATPLSLPALLTGGSIPSAMGVVIEDGVIRLTGGSASVGGTINADGTGAQRGGNAIAYGENHLNFSGTISAKGGELGGNGGFVDTSGNGSITIAPNAKVLTTAPKGLMGTWVIDPFNIQVVESGAIGTSTINASQVVNALNSSNVDLRADNAITVYATIDASGNTNAGNLKLSTPTATLYNPIVLKEGSTLSGTATTVNVGPTGTIQNGIDVAAAGGTVNLAPATYTLAKTVELNKNITVRGAGLSNTTVSGNNRVQVFRGIGALTTATLEGMSIVNGRSEGRGGGIDNGQGVVILNDSLVANNFAQMGGGGVSKDSSGIMIINNSTIANNSIGSGSLGAGIYNGPGGGITLRNSTVSDNMGNGIFARGGVSISNSTISGNLGPGIAGRSATVSNSTISNNQVGISIETPGGSGLSVDNSIISGNGTTGAGREISFIGNPATLSLNYNVLGFGGSSGVDMPYGTPVSLNSTNIVPTVPLNQILAPLANNGGLTQTHALVAGSPALNSGNPNSALTTDQRGGQRGPAGLNAGSRIDIGAYEATSSALVTNTLDNNTTGTLRTAINFANGNTNPIASTAPTDIRFNIGNTGTAQTIALTSALPKIVKATTIDGWTQGISGYQGLPLITVSGEERFRVFEIGNTTARLNGLAIVKGKTDGQGGGILSNATLTIDNSTISGNTAGSGGGIATQNGRLTLNKSTLSGNSATNNGIGFGGGIDSFNSGVTINNSTLSGNTAASGGGIYNNGGPVTINNSTLSGNSTTGGGLGGAIFNFTSGVTLNNSTISGNSSGIFNRGTLTVSSSTISNNQGSGIYSTTQGGLSVNNSIISGNGTNGTISEGREILFIGDPARLTLNYNILGFSGNSGVSASVHLNSTNIVPRVALNRILAPLANNGGPTQTHALVSRSPAINAGDPNSSLTIDQRGQKRGRAGINTGSRIDIGSYEATSSRTSIATWINFILSLLNKK